MKETAINKRHGWQLFDIVNYALLGIFSLATLYPVWIELVTALSTQESYTKSFFHIIPTSFTLDNFKDAVLNPWIFRSCCVSMVITFCGTLICLVMNTIGAYALSKEHLRGRTFFFILIIITMFFGGGLAPTYMLVTKTLHMGNTLWALILPGAVSTGNMLLMMHNIRTIPPGLEEAAKIDGCNDIQVLWHVVVPSCKPIIMTMALFFMVGFWNDWFPAVLYITETKYFPLALVLRNMIMSSFGQSAGVTSGLAMTARLQSPELLKAATIIISIIPVVAAYPFVQKYFVQGLMLGGIKE